MPLCLFVSEGGYGVARASGENPEVDFGVPRPSVALALGGVFVCVASAEEKRQSEEKK